MNSTPLAQPPRRGSLKAICELLAASVQPKAYSLITVAELKKRLAGPPKCTVIDCRAPEDFNSGHIPGSINRPYLTFMRDYRSIPNSAPVVTVCYVGAYSRAAAQKLGHNGWKETASLRGGFEAWRDAGLPLERT